MVSHRSMALLLVGLVMGASCQPPVYPGPGLYQYEEAAAAAGAPVSRQGFTLAAVLGPLVSTVLVPLVSNLANGFTNAVTATFANRRLAIIPMDSFPLRSNDIGYSDGFSDGYGPHFGQDHETR